MKVLSFIRQSKEETVLVIINLVSEPLTDYDLLLSSGPLSGKYNAVPLLGEGKFSSLVINERGGFKDYMPLPELPANARIILQLQKK